MILYIYDSLLVVHVEFSFFVKWKGFFRISLGLRFLLSLLLFIIIFILISSITTFKKLWTHSALAVINGDGPCENTKEELNRC